MYLGADLGDSPAGLEVILTTAANPGGAWTPALVQAFTASGGLTTASPPETVEVQPLAGTLDAGSPYFARDTGATGSGGRRRLRVERAGGTAAAAGFPVDVVTAVFCFGDVVGARFKTIGSTTLPSGEHP